jgi:hypothetical protein
MHLLNCQFKDGNTCGYSNSTHDIAYWTLDQSVSLSNTGTINIYITIVESFSENKVLKAIWH